MYCKTASSRCGVSNTSHSRGERRARAMKSVAQSNSLEKVEHLKVPVNYQTGRFCTLFFVIWNVFNGDSFHRCGQVEACRQRILLSQATSLQAKPKTIKICMVKETAVLCAFICHLFFKILGIILDDITLQLTGSKHSYFRAEDCFRGDDITQSRWAPPKIVSLSHTLQLHRPLW